MAEGTVRGAFDLDVGPAVRGVREYRQEAARADATTRELGQSMDSVFGPSTAANLKAAREQMGGLATTARDTRITVRDQWKGMSREVQREAASIVSTIAVVRDRMRALGREKAELKIDVDGVTAALAQVELLHERLSAIGNQRISPRVSINNSGFGTAAARAAAGASPGGGRGSGMLSLGSVGFAGLKGPQFLAAGALALPGAQALGGAAVGLAGSAGAAGLGAGVVGAGGLAPLAAGILGVLAAAKPAQAALKDAWKAQDNLTKAVRQYGRDSTQARQAQDALNRATRGRPGVGYAAAQGRGLVADWKRLSAPAAQQYYGLLGDVAQIGRRVAPLQAQNSLTATTAVRQQGSRYARFLAGTETQGNVAAMTQMFARELPTVERTFENLTLTAERLARASLPYFHEANAWVRDWSFGLRTSTRDVDATSRKMRPLVDSAKKWAELTGSTYHLLRDIMGMSAPAGDSLVVSLTRTFDRWDAWMQTHPEQVRQFFSDTAESVRDMARGLSQVVGFLNDLATALRPVLDRFSQLVGLTASLGLLGTPGTLAGLMGGAKALRGGGAAGGAAAGAAGSAGGTAAAMAAGLGVAAVRTNGRGEMFGARGTTPLAGERVYGAGFRYGGLESQLGARQGRLAAGGSRLLGGVRGAGKAALPVMVALSALDFASYKGNPAERAQQAFSGLTFGLSAAPVSRGEALDKASADAGLFLRSPKSDAQLEAERTHARQGLGYFQQAGATGLLGTAKDFSWNVAGEKSPRTFSGRGGMDELKEYVRLLDEEAKTRKAANDEMKRARSAHLDESSRQRAIEYGAGLPAAYRAYRRGGLSQETAVGRTVDQVQSRLKSTRPAGVEALGEASLDWARAMARGNPKLKKQVDELNDSIEKRFRQMGQRVSIVNGDILTGSRSEWRQIRDAMITPAEQARERVSDDFTAIQNKAVGSLTAMGFSQKDAKQLVAGSETPQGRSNLHTATKLAGSSNPGVRQAGLNVPDAVAMGNKRARGGVVGGRGLMDTVAMGDGLVAPGEAWIANRHTLDKLSQATLATYGLTAQQIITGESRPHSMPGGRFATGGSMDLPSGASTTAARARVGGLAGVNAAVSSIANAALAQFPGLSITSTTGGGHAAGSFHYRGAAVDLAGGDMNAAAAWIGQRYGSRLAEGIHNPNLSVKGGRSVSPSFWGAQTWAAHANHIHVAALGGAIRGGGAAAGLAAGAQAQINVGGVGRQQAGVAGILRQRAGDIYAAGLTRQVNAALGADAGGGGAPTRGVMTFDQVARLAESVGLPGVTFAQIAHGESGYNPRAIGHDPGGTIGLGLWQITTKYNDDVIARFGGRNAMLNAHTNALAARAIYDRAGIGAWYGTRYMTDPNAHYTGAARGGRVHFAGAFDRGGEFLTNGPTAFVAGEGPRHRRERVSIRPANTSGGDGVHVVIEAGAVVVQTGGVHSEADAEKVGALVARKIVDAIQRAKVSG